MTYHNVAATASSFVGGVYFIGPSAVFSRVALRTVENELDGPTHRFPDMDALRFARMTKTGSVNPAHMVVVHESSARALLSALEQGADYLPKHRLAIAFENETTACALFADICDELLQWRVSLLPMNTNVTNWVRLLQVIQAGGHYVPPELLQTRAQDRLVEVRPGFAHGRANDPAPEIARGSETHKAGHSAGAREARAPDGLTPREAEVLAMAAAGSPNKLIAGELELSEHTVKLYMHRIIGKLGVRNRTEAAVWYHQNGQGA